MLENDYKKNKKLFITLICVALATLVLGIVKQVLLKPAKASEKTIYQSFYKASKQISADTVQQRAFADCCLEKIRSKYPDVEAIDQDSVTEIYNIVITDCANTIKYITWTPTIENSAIKKFSSLDNLKKFSVEKRIICTLRINET